MTFVKVRCFERYLLLLFRAFGRLALLGFELGFGGFEALGARFGALFTLLVEQLFGAEQLDEDLLAAITLAPAAADDAQIATAAVAVARGHVVEQAVDRLRGHQVSTGLASGMRVAALAEG